MSLQAPFPYFGGKRRAAPAVWAAIGDPGGYVEPFAGSLAVLLARPPATGRRVETVNDLDGWLVNMWRAIQLRPAEVAEHAWGPVTEIDYHARLAWLQERRTPELVSWLEGDPETCDAKAAGWWLYVAACAIGDPWGPGPWRVVDGHLVKTGTGQGVNRELPHLGNAGRGVNRGEVGDLAHYLGVLQRRLARVRITCGDWRRVVAPSVIRATAGNSITAAFFDPPYSTSGDLYASTAASNGVDIDSDVRRWCADNGGTHRIVLCGYNSDHDELLRLGWRVELGKSGRGAGYSTDSRAGRRERLWISPSCPDSQTLFGIDGAES